MGSDYAWWRCRLPGEAGPAELDAVLGVVRRDLEAGGYRAAPGPDWDAEDEGAGPRVRSFVAFGDGPWVQVGDLARSTQFQGAFPEEGPRVSTALSSHWPTVSMRMSDSAVLYLDLWRGGARRDRYVTQWMNWELLTEADLAEVSGTPEEWELLLDGSADLEALRRSWEMTEVRPGAYRGRSAETVLAELAGLLGWDEDLVTVGFSHDSDGIFIPWSGFLEDAGPRRRLVQELHMTAPEGGLES